MRKIKFRAWDKIEKELITKYESLAFKDNWVFLEVEYKKNHFSELSWHSDDIELMQYTGLKDKNGTDIFESDIVKYNMIDRFGLCKIEYTEECRFTAQSLNMVNCRGFSLKKDIITFNKYSEKTRDIEVIGNIYENPELLGA